ncbi:MAG: type VI secretion system contractile sheath large subunit [Desulfovibrio sp.]|nr:type VI secretion system contractile sheath large subunit [Desulfovibrio sp.]
MKFAAEALTVGDQAARSGLPLLLRALLLCGEGAKVSVALVDGLIVELDAKISMQLSAILHHERFRQLETSWRSLKFLTDRVDFQQNIILQFMNLSKEDLLSDLEDSPEVTISGFYRQVYVAEYGQFGGQPVGAVIANYEFSPCPSDIRLLTHVASVAAMAHAPFIAGAGKEFFGCDSWEAFSTLRDLRSIFEMPQYAAWRAFRASDDARYVCLTLPGFLFRLPYGIGALTTKTFAFAEQLDGVEDLCWGNAAFALADRLADSFARYRWCVNIIGPQGGGVVENLPLYSFGGNAREYKIPTRVLISEQREFELSDEGFISLAIRRGVENAVFFSATTCQKPKIFDSTLEGKDAEISSKLSAQLPYMMIMNRLIHYIKVLHRENIGSWKDRNMLEMELNKWMNQYVTEMDTPDAVTRSRRPLRMATIAVSEVPHNPNWFEVAIRARPHFKFMGADFTLSLTGKLDRE